MQCWPSWTSWNAFEQLLQNSYCRTKSLQVCERKYQTSSRWIQSESRQNQSGLWSWRIRSWCHRFWTKGLTVRMRRLRWWLLSGERWRRWVGQLLRALSRGIERWDTRSSVEGAGRGRCSYVEGHRPPMSGWLGARCKEIRTEIRRIDLVMFSIWKREKSKEMSKKTKTFFRDIKWFLLNCSVLKKKGWNLERFRLGVRFTELVWWYSSTE